MKNCILFALSGSEKLTAKLADISGIEIGSLETRHFPDGESYIRINSDVKNKIVILIYGLEYPDDKILSLLFIAKTVRELGSKKICLISPYLPYMRQDKRFKSGEAVSSILFAGLISECINHLITVDPHLHRIKNLSDIYSIDSVSVLHSTKNIADWISNNIDSPYIIGPDEESEQWIGEVARFLSAPYTIIKKTRHGDREVSISMPGIDVKNITLTPILIDDIISTGTSMVTAIQELLSRGFKTPVCISVHALFDDETYQKLLKAGAKQIVSCNTIPHKTNQIDITNLIIEEINYYLQNQI